MASLGAGGSDSNSIVVYPTVNGYVGQFNFIQEGIVNKSNKKTLKDPDTTGTRVVTYVILDRSGSMGQQVNRLVTKILPATFISLGYKETDKINLISFDGSAIHEEMTISSLRKSRLQAGGCTIMSAGINLLINHVNTWKEPTSFRLVTISDGEVSDTEETQMKSGELTQLLKLHQHTVNAQAVRFFTSNSQPDTRALSSLLQINNTTSSATVCDVNAYSGDTDTIASQISNLFLNDSLGSSTVLKTINHEKVLQSLPWNSPADYIQLAKGMNTFWMSTLPKSLIMGSKHSKEEGGANEQLITIVEGSSLSFTLYERILQPSLDLFLNQLRILKVVNTEESKLQIQSILAYFTSVEQHCALTEANDIAKNSTNVVVEGAPRIHSLKSRFELLKTMINRNKRSIVMKMSQIANDDRIASLNSAQQADYLRTLDVSSKNAKGLARRVATQQNDALDPTTTLQKQIRKMAQHINELDQIDDSTHTVSFYSQDTTLGGLKALCELVTNNLIDEMDIHQILQMINIVGVACDGPIGEYPDPMTWRVNKVHVGCYVSLSDVLTVVIQSGNNRNQFLRTPGTNLDITTVIPFFDDSRIHRFIRKYIPSILELTAGIGMRRILGEVPMTFAYTVCAGIWNLIAELETNTSEIYTQTLIKLIDTYQTAIGTYFYHIHPLLVADSPSTSTSPSTADSERQGLSLHLGNNGVTNLIGPLINLFRQPANDKHSISPEQIKRILRALYTYEVSQAVRRLFKNNPDGQTIIKENCKELMGIDLQVYKTHVQPVFEAEPVHPTIHHQYAINLTKLDTLIKLFWYNKYIALLPVILHPEKLTALRSNQQQTITEQVLCDAMGINYDWKLFQFYNVVQAFLFPDKQSRIDETTDPSKPCMKIVDLGNQELAEKMVTDFIREQYMNQYKTDLAQKQKEERELLATQLVEKMVSSTDKEEFIRLFKEGIVHPCPDQPPQIIVNQLSLGFIDLHKQLLNLTLTIPLRLFKLFVVLTGCAQYVPREANRSDFKVWNNGNALHVPDYNVYRNVFDQQDPKKGLSKWAELEQYHQHLKMHRYRDSNNPNRHGHSNDKPSYWAKGFETLEIYQTSVSADEFATYCKIHHDCCGVSQLKTV